YIILCGIKIQSVYDIETILTFRRLLFRSAPMILTEPNPMSIQCWVVMIPSPAMIVTAADPASKSPTMRVKTHRTLMPGACLCISHLRLPAVHRRRRSLFLGYHAGWWGHRRH